MLYVGQQLWRKQMTEAERKELEHFRANPHEYMVSDLAYERYMKLLAVEKDNEQ